MPGYAAKTMVISLFENVGGWIGARISALGRVSIVAGVTSAGAGLTGCGDTSPPPPISSKAGVVAVLEAADGDDAVRDELIAAGARTYRLMGCVTCHAMDATPMTGPRLSRLYENPVELIAVADPTDPSAPSTKTPDGTWQDRDRPYLWRSIAHPQADVVKGYDGAQRMTHFGHLMDDHEVAGLIAYLESKTRKPAPQPAQADSQD